MKKLVFTLMAVSIGLTFSCKDSEAPTSKLITPDELVELSSMEEVQLVDVRTPEEYSEGFIEGFQNIDFMSDSFEKNIDKLDKTKPVVVYCKAGGRSAKCSKKMLDAGFVKIYDLDGGITKWKYEGFDIEGQPN